MGSRKLYLLTTLILPITAILFFAYLFSKSVPEDLPIAVCDQDQTHLSAKLLRMIDSGPSVKITESVPGLKDGQYLIKTGKVYGLVHIPKGFEKDIYSGKGPAVSAYFNNVYMLPGGLINKDVSTIVKTFSAGVNFNKRIKKGQDQKSAMTAVNPVAMDTHILFNPYTSYLYYLSSAFLPIMLIMFVLLSSVYAIGIELKKSTASEWIESAGGSIFKALLGKFLPYFICFTILGIFMNILLFKFFDVPQHESLFLMTYNTGILIMAYIACGILIISIFNSLRMALSVASIFAAMTFTFSGLTFPFLAMDGRISFLGNFFPFTHYLKIFIDQNLRAAPFHYSWLSILMIHLFILIPLITGKHLKKVCLDSKYWGKS